MDEAWIWPTGSAQLLMITGYGLLVISYQKYIFKNIQTNEVSSNWLFNFYYCIATDCNVSLNMKITQR